MNFCPRCFTVDEELNVLKETDKYECPECGSTFPLSATMVSEQVVRTYIAAAPMSSVGIRSKLEELVK